MIPRVKRNRSRRLEPTQSGDLTGYPPSIRPGSKRVTASGDRWSHNKPILPPWDYSPNMYHQQVQKIPTSEFSLKWPWSGVLLATWQQETILIRGTHFHPKTQNPPQMLSTGDEQLMATITKQTWEAGTMTKNQRKCNTVERYPGRSEALGSSLIPQRL